jgi:biotin carboxylase
VKRKAVPSQLSDQEAHLIAQLRRHPEMMERFQSILDLASSTDGPLKTADEVEELLVEEVRKLGHATMSHWAVGAEERVSQELKEQQPEVLSRKKKR